jgi:hypothetical protein
MQWASRTTQSARSDLQIACEQRIGKSEGVIYIEIRTFWLAQNRQKFILTQRIKKFPTIMEVRASGVNCEPFKGTPYIDTLLLYSSYTP